MPCLSELQDQRGVEWPQGRPRAARKPQECPRLASSRPQALKARQERAQVVVEPQEAKVGGVAK